MYYLLWHIVSPFVTSWCLVKKADWIKLVLGTDATLGLSYTV